MRLESQLQSIQCGGSSFPLDISQFSFVLYTHDSRCASLLIEPPGMLPWMANHTFGPQLCSTREAFLLGLPSQTIMTKPLSLFTKTASITTFIHPRTTKRSQTGPLAQHILLCLSSVHNLTSKIKIKSAFQTQQHCNQLLQTHSKNSNSKFEYHKKLN